MVEKGVQYVIYAIILTLLAWVGTSIEGLKEGSVEMRVTMQFMKEKVTTISERVASLEKTRLGGVRPWRERE